MRQLTVNKRFRDLIPPLSNEERDQLEANILADGCRDPLVVWPRMVTSPGFEDVLEAAETGGKVYCKYCYEEHTVEYGQGNIECDTCGYGLAPLEYQDVLIDGHNRYEICQKHGIEFTTSEIEFDTDDDALKLPE